jgi:hypothetical protein
MARIICRAARRLSGSFAIIWRQSAPLDAVHRHVCWAEVSRDIRFWLCHKARDAVTYSYGEYRSVVLNITGESYRMRAYRARASKLRRGDGAP